MQFQPEVYKACDDPAKEVVSAYLTKRGWACAAPEMYAKADITAIKGELLNFHEVEIKRVWRDGLLWPTDWKTITIPYRKHKLFHVGEFLGNKRYRTHDPKMLFFWIISGDCKSAWVVPASKVKAIEEKYVNAGPYRGMDKFFKVRCQTATRIYFT